MQEIQPWVPSRGQEDPLEEDMATTPVFLPGESHERRSLVGCSPQVAKSWTRLSDLTFTLPASGVSPLVPTLFLSLLFLYSSVALLPQVGSLLDWSRHQENKNFHCFHFSPFYLPLSGGTRCHDLSFLDVKF